MEILVTAGFVLAVVAVVYVWLMTLPQDEDDFGPKY